MIKGYFIYKDFFLKTLFLGCFFIFFIIQSEEKPNATEVNSSKVTNLVQKAVKKSFTEKYPITYASVESGMYLQQIIANYNLHIKHAIAGLLKKELEQGHIYTKELSYLLGQLNTVTTIKKAIVVLARAISAYKDMIQENPSYQDLSDWHESAYSTILLQCSVVLINVAREQLLMTLDEIHNSLLYWQDQKEAPIKYFFRKSPFKWVMGKRQADEIAINIRKLKKLEYNVRVILGHLTKHIYDFNVNGDVNDCYEWINTLLSTLTVVGTDTKQIKYESSFEEVAEKLKFKLTHVFSLKNLFLSKISFAIKPGHITRNWLLYAIAALGAYQAHNFYINQSDFVHEALSRTLKQIVETWDMTIDPLKGAWKTIFAPSAAVTPEGENLIMKRAEEIQKVLPGLEAKKEELSKLIGEGPGMKEGALSQLQNLLETGRSTYYGFGWSKEQKSTIMKEARSGNLEPLEEAISATRLINPKLKIELSEILIKLKIADYVRLSSGIGVDVAMIIPPIAGATESVIAILGEFVKSNALNMKLLTLIPAFGIALGANKMYHWMIERDFSSIRLALLDINSLFIESAAPLSNHDYGKLIYLIQKLKLQAMRYLKSTDMREEFLHDLAKLESNKFDVETKRKIIKNIFMKYPFLTIKAKSA